jgi:hypothetical protein
VAFLAGAALTVVSVWSNMDISAPRELQPLFIVGVIFLLVAGGGIINWLREYKVDIYEQGFIYSTAFETVNVHWEDVIAVWQAKRVRQRNGPTTSATYTVLLKNKKKFIIDSERFKNPEGLGDAIQKEVTRCLMPKYFQLLKSGDTVDFGKLKLSRRGISNLKETIPWSQVRDVRVNLGMINVNKDGKWLVLSSVYAHEIPNLYVFLTLIDQIVDVRS